MKHFTPALNTKDASLNSRDFTRENMDIFWSILKPLLPYIIALNFIDMLVTALYMENSKHTFTLGSVVASYFLGMLMISWHRVVIHGPDRFEPANPFKPQKNELAFIFVPCFAVIAAILIAGGFIGLMIALGGKAAAVLAIFVFVAFFTYAFLRIAFYLPGKAINADMTLRKSWHMTKGYLWKIFAANMRATWRLLLVAMVVIFGAMFVFGAIGGILFQAQGLGFHFLLFIGQLPLIVFFQPLLTVIGVTVISNYYQWAINNPRPGEI